ncbi:MAG: sodium-dependent transporter [Muribaculaceae bacterium]|nr:sodium-dependent transporter [Muribaculaceae bacterium]
MLQNDNRAQFSTRLGVIATTVGSAVGLGNIWRFPYEAGTHGGGAFLITYLCFIFAFGIPILCAEFMIGRGTHSNIFGAFRQLRSSGKWHWVGYIGIVASIMILSFYSVVAGWTLEDVYHSITGALNLNSQEAYHAQFQQFSTHPWRPLLWTILFLIVNFVIVIRGVQKGIERMSNIMMPILFLILIIFCVNSLLMPGAKEGLEFLFSPDFSKIDSSVMVSAMGQAFFSLSLGLGTMMTYASYFSKETHIVKSATITACLDTTVAILSGVIIFPAVFTFGVSPTQGPALVFEVLPNIFNQLPGSTIWSILFFFLLFIASLSSTISMSEVSIAYFTEEKKMSRNKATILNTAIALIFGTLCALSFNCLDNITIAGMTIFSIFDYVSSNILLPAGGMFISFFAGWLLDRSFIHDQLTNNGSVKVRVTKAIIFSLKYVAPTGIILVFLSSLKLI